MLVKLRGEIAEQQSAAVLGGTRGWHCLQSPHLPAHAEARPQRPVRGLPPSQRSYNEQILQTKQLFAGEILPFLMPAALSTNPII